MRLPRLEIHTTKMKISTTTTDPVQEIKQPKANLNIEQPAAILEISSTAAKLDIDTSQARRDIGLIGPLESTEKHANEAKQNVIEYIEKTAQEGRQMVEMAGKQPGVDTLQQIAWNEAKPKHSPINIKFIPSVGSVKIDYIPGKLDINVQPQKAKIDVQTNKPIINYTPGKVETDITQYPDIQIDVKW